MSRFNWDRDCGSYSPTDAVRDARESGLTLDKYVAIYSLSDPFALGNGWLDVDGMIAAMKEAEEAESEAK
jgi:hypothetical protein